jgi:hypothetical protein
VLARRGARSPLDVFLFPAVVGGGLGDVAEVLDAGDRLARHGFRPRIVRLPGHPWPARLRDHLRGRRAGTGPFRPAPGTRALTIAPMWEVSAAPARGGPLGRPGPWSAEAEAIEAAYGPGRVVHLSLEEFARTATAREETLERFREGGRPVAEARRFLATRRGRAEVAAYRRAYRRFRGFDRGNLLHLYATFRPSRAFQRECPEAIQTGPLWPDRRWPRASGRANTPRRWVWYASPSTAVRLAAAVERGLKDALPPVRVRVRTPRGPAGWPSDPRWKVGGQVAGSTWAREFAAADLRIVTGSRTLLEALELGGPFLYFNGVMGTGPRARRHRPEKIRALRSLLGRRGWSGVPWRDLEDFSRGRRVEAVVRSAARLRRRSGGARPLALRHALGTERSAGDVLVRAARGWSASGEPAPRFVAEFRAVERARAFPSGRRPRAATPAIRAGAVGR